MKRVLITCGGTGGHIYPGIAIASKIVEHDKDAQILFIGTKQGMENRLVPAAGFEIRGIDASGIDRHHLLNNFKTLENSIKGSHEAAEIIREFAPDIAIGTGGYVTGTVIMQAHKAGIPCYIHEQNAIPGLTNRMLERFASKLFISFEESAKYFRHPEKTVLTGNPIRGEFSTLDREECRKKLGLSDETFILLFGGSLGAEVLNEACLDLISKLPESGVKLCFVTGKRYYGQIKERLEASKEIRPSLILMDYADNMPELMTASDIIISRAGAIAVSEILACGKPSVLVPSPNVTNNHQYHNAKSIADRNAALLAEEKDMIGNYGSFSETVLALANDRARIDEMSKAARKIAVTDAAEKIYRGLEI